MIKRRLFAILGTIPGVVLGAALVHGCGETSTPPTIIDGPGCDFICPEEGVADGNSAISGTGSIDTFFASVIRFQVAATRVGDALRTELDAIGASVGAAPGNDGDLKAKLAAKLEENVEGDLKVSYEPPRCAVSAKAVLAAQAKCEGSIDPPSASVQCKGTCDVEAGVAVACGGHATLSCTGTINAQLRDKLSIVRVVGLACGIEELPKAIGVVKDAAASVTAESKVAVDVLSSIGGR